MPLLDHFHPPLSERRPWESFHSTWCGSLADYLNRDRDDMAGEKEQAVKNQYEPNGIHITGDRGQRNEVMRRLAERDIETRPGTHAVHRLGFYAKRYGYRPQDFPNAALCEDTTITLPLCPGMSDADQHQVVETLAAALRC